MILLGQTTILELEGVLDASTSGVRRWINGLQAYHLLAMSAKGSGGPLLSAPDDLALTKDLLRAHLGLAAQDVEKAVARVRAAAERSAADIGVIVGQVVGLWRRRQFEEALIVAREAVARHSSNGDLLCLLGNAYLNVSPPRNKEADRSFEEAYSRKCRRTELFEGWVRAKEGMQDWPGLLSTCTGAIRDAKASPLVVEAYARAATHIVSLATQRNDLPRAAEVAIEAVDTITSTFKKGKLPKADFDVLFAQRFAFARTYYSISERINVRPDDHVNVFEAVYTLSQSGVLLADLIRSGIDKLDSWWKAVELRHTVDRAPCTILNKCLSKAEHIERLLEKTKADNGQLVAHVQRVRLELAHRGGQRCQ